MFGKFSIINAFAFGRLTLAYTRGLLSFLSPDEIKGILAHEFGHLNYGHPAGSLVSAITNLPITILINGFLAILRHIEADPSSGPTNMASRGFVKLFELTLQLLPATFNLILMATSRSNEYKADKFAYDIGYGQHLTTSLYQLRNMEAGSKRMKIKNLKSTHPYLDDRIIRLENMGCR